MASLARPSVPSAPLLHAALLGLLGGCASERASEAEGKITASEVDTTMTLTRFTALCDEAGGQVETHPHCGGVNTCRGFSYDETIHTFTEHSCKGANTCAGWSCVLGPEG
jgi:hypothetical protein